MKATNEALTDERVAALVRCMRSPPPGASRRRASSSTAFVAVSVAPSGRYTVALVQAELDRIAWHLRTALAAIGRWFLHAV